MKQDSGYKLSSGEVLYWDYVYSGDKENGFEIYVGDASIPIQTQPEPFIKYPNKTYEENAVLRCKELAEMSNTPVEKPFVMTESMYTGMQSNIDYLMLLNDPDSAAETTE